MKQQLNLFFHALMFYSRIPAGKIDYSEDNLTKAFRYFPLVGIIAAAIGAGVFMLSGLIFPHTVSVIAAMIAIVLATGAIHEDGLSDFFDGFGGGHTKERILAIMKDSTIGAYGVIALIFLFLLKFSLFLSFDAATLPLLLIAAHGSSRVMPIVMINTSRYARTENSKAMHARHKTDKTTFIIALIIGFAPLVFIPWQVTAVVIPVYFGMCFLLKRYVEKKIDGFTGDILGALQQFCELAFYLVFLAVK